MLTSGITPRPSSLAFSLPLPARKSSNGTAGLGSVRFGQQGQDTAPPVELTPQELPQVLAPVLQKRWNRLGAENRRASHVIISDINDYFRYQSQPWLFRKISRFFIGLFDPWRKTPQFLSLREQLKHSLASQGIHPTAQDPINQAFGQVFDQTLNAFRGVLLQNQPRFQPAIDKQLLTQGLREGARMNQGPLNPVNQYYALLRHFANLPVDMPDPNKPQEASLPSLLKEGASLLLKLPENLTQHTAQAERQAAALGHSIRRPSAVPGTGGWVFSPDSIAFVPDGKGGMVMKHVPGGIKPLDPYEENGGLFHLSAPDFLHPQAVQKILERTFNHPDPLNATPNVVLGAPEDQKDVLTHLSLTAIGQENTVGDYTHALVFKSAKDNRFHHRWDDLPVASLEMVDHQALPLPSGYPFGPGRDNIEILKRKMAFLEAQAEKTNRQMMLYLVGQDELTEVLSELPRVASRYPNVKVVVAGLKEIPMGIGGQALNQFEMLKVEPPGEDVAIERFLAFKEQSQGQGPLEVVQRHHNVQFTPQALERVVKILAETNGRAPSVRQILNKLENIGAWARQQALQAEAVAEAKVAGRSTDNVASKAKNESPMLRVLPLDAGVVDEYETQYQKMLQAHMGASDIANIRFYKSKMKLDYVKGLDEHIGQLRNDAQLLRQYALLNRIEEAGGGKNNLPKLFVLTGPPGTGKTMLAEALAGEVGVKMIRLSASELINKYVGSTAEKIRTLYDVAIKNSPCLVFLDEIDALATERHATQDGGREVQTGLNQLLTELDRAPGVITVVATNHYDMLDSAFTNRKDGLITFKMPDAKAREEILNVQAQLSGRRFSPSVDFAYLASDDNTREFSGRELEKLIARAARKTLLPMAGTLERAAKQLNPDLRALCKKMPMITQADLLAELAEMQREDPKQKPFGFGIQLAEREYQRRLEEVGKAREKEKRRKKA